MPNQFQGTYATIVRSQAESTYGTEPTTVTGTKLPIVSESLAATLSLNESTELDGSRNPTEGWYGFEEVEGDIEFALDSVILGYHLQALLGDPVSVSGATYTHTFKVTSCLNSYTYEKAFTDPCSAQADVYLSYPGCKIDTLGFNFESSDTELTATATLVGATETVGVAAMDASPTVETGGLKFSNANVVLYEGGVEIATGRSLTVSVNNNLDRDTRTLGTSSRNSLPDGKCQVTGTIEVNFDSIDLYNKAVNGTESSVQAVVTNGTHSFDLKVNELKYEKESPKIEGPGGVYTVLNFVGHYKDHADASVVTAVLINGKTSY